MDNTYEGLQNEIPPAGGAAEGDKIKVQCPENLGENGHKVKPFPSGGPANDEHVEIKFGGPESDEAGPGAASLEPDYNKALSFLEALDPKAQRFTFQTFDEDKARKDSKLAGTRHGTLEQHWSELKALNARGAGVFVTVNETDFKGREAHNIVRVRSVFVDLDAPKRSFADVEKHLEAFPLAPSMLVESSPGKWHAYWLVSDWPIPPGEFEANKKAFRAVQEEFISLLGGDAKVKDLPRVLRLPGFVHQKGAPFLTRVERVLPCHNGYARAEIEAALDQVKPDQAGPDQAEPKKARASRVGGGRRCNRLKELADKWAKTHPGGGARNSVLSECAFAAGVLAARGLFREEQALAAFKEAGLENGQWREEPERCEETFARQFKTGFEKARKEAEEKQADALAAVEELNEDYLFVMEQGKATIFHESYDSVMQRRVINRLQIADFKHAFCNQHVEVNGRQFPLGAFWITNPNRRQYLGGVVFDPAAKHADDEYNLWRGFGLEPKPGGSWGRLQDHMLKIVCGGNEEHYAYLYRWMANAVQSPWRQGEVVIVMRGEEGTGKGIVARAMMRLFGQHGLHITNAVHLVGRFNAHLQDCVFLFADEAFYAGDKQHTSVLKGLITEPTHAIEGKFRAVTQARNYAHIMMASNEDWVVPAGKEARRFCVFDVLGDKMGDEEYFRAIVDELESGGYEAMLHELQQVDLSGFSVRKFPKTAALRDQKLLSLDPPDEWLYNILDQGFVRFSDYNHPEMLEWHEAYVTSFLYDAYLRFAKERGFRGKRLLAANKFGELLSARGFIHKKTSTALSGEDTPGIRTNKQRARSYVFGPLDQARETFAKALNLQIDWTGEGEEGEEGEDEEDTSPI